MSYMAHVSDSPATVANQEPRCLVAFRSVVSTVKANGASVLDTVRFVLSTKLSVEPLAGVG